MALTKVSGGILDPGINVAGIVTATGFDGPFTGGSSRNITAGILTATELDINGSGDISGNLVVHGNLTANGDFTTLNTTLREVELLRVDAQDDNVAAGIITQRGSGDILNLYDGSTEVFTVTDGGSVGIGSDNPTQALDIVGNIKASGTITGSSFVGALPISNDGNNRVITATGTTGTLNAESNFTYDGSSCTLKGTTDGVLNLDTTDGRGTFIRFQEGGATKVWVGCSEGIGTGGDQDDLGLRATDNIIMRAGSDERLRITGIGSVGINEDDPKALLHVATDNGQTLPEISASFPLIVTKNSNAGIAIIAKNDAKSILAFGDTDDADRGKIQYVHTSGDNSESMQFITAGGEKLRIDSNGDINLGDNPTNQYGYKLNIQDSAIIYAQTASSGGLEAKWHLDNSAQLMEFGTVTTDHLSLVTTNIRRLTIDSSGKVGIGTTNPDYGLHVYGAGDILVEDNSNGSAHLRLRSSNNGSDVSNWKIKTGSNNHLYIENDTVGGATQVTFDPDANLSIRGEYAAAQDYPDLRPTLDLNFAAVKELDSRIVFYRNSTATSINEHGLVSYSGFNEPRFDHDVTTRQSKGLLIEPSIANWIRYSTNLSGSGWGLNNTTTTLAPDVVAPDGTTGSVYENMENSSSSYHATYYSASIPVTNNQYYSISSWVKRGPNYRTDINNGDYQFYCSRGTGSVATVSISSDFKSIVSHSNTVDRSITLFPNDWVRVTYSFQSNQDNSSVTPHWLHGNGGTYLGNGTSSVYIWGCQFEQLTYPTSYVPTDQGNVVYRGSEQCVIDGTDFSDFYNPLESSVYVDGIMNVPSSYPGQYNILNIGDSNANGHGIFRENGTKDVWYHIRNNDSTPSGGNLNPSGFGDWDRGEEARIAVAFKDGDQAISVNGGNQVTATVTSSYPTANITKMWIGSAGDNGSGQFSGTIGRIMYYPKQLTDNQLNTLTA